MSQFSLCVSSVSKMMANLKHFDYEMYRKEQMSRAKPVWVLSHDSMTYLAKAVVQCCDQWQRDLSSKFQSFEMRTIQYQSILEWKKFPDGFPNLFIQNVKEMAGKDIIFIASFADVSNIFAEISMLFELPRYLAHSLTVLLPYFPTGTMERIDIEGQVATAKTLATILSQIPPTARGPTQIMIFDIHALQERFYFTRDVIPRLETAIPLLIDELRKLVAQLNGESVCIAFPDEGAHKRFSSYFASTYERLICAKTRKGIEGRVIKIREGDPNGKHVVIVDDLVQTGGTLIESAQVLKSAGAKSVSAFVTHAVFPNESWRKFLPSEDEPSLFDNFWISDSIPHSVEIATRPPFKLLSLAPLISKTLLGFDLKQWD